MASTQTQVDDFTKLPGKLVKLDGYQEKLWEFPPISVIGKQTRNWVIYAGVTRNGPKTNAAIEKGYYSLESGKFPVNLAGFYFTISGVVDGKEVISAPTLVYSGKNLGKKNATNVWTQTLRDAFGKWSKKSERSDYTGFYPPQLVMNLEDRSATLQWDKIDYFVQRKYDGIRAIAQFDHWPPRDATDVIFYSRSRKLFPPKFLGIKKAIYQMYKKHPQLWDKDRRLDGELYVHGESLQIISGATRRSEVTDIDDKLGYIVYDTFRAIDSGSKKYDVAFRKRWDWLTKAFRGVRSDRICLAPIWSVRTISQVEKKYDEFIKDGYEGVILRDGSSPYYFSWNGYRNVGILRKKQIHSSEFEIVDWKLGKGKYADMVVFVVKTPDGDPFSVDPKWKDDYRKDITKKLPVREPNGKTHFENNYKGRMATVEYQDKSDKGVPIRAKLVVVRDYE